MLGQHKIRLGMRIGDPVGVGIHVKECMREVRNGM